MGSTLKGRLGLFFFLLFFSWSSCAQEGLFGAEWTFSSELMILQTRHDQFYFNTQLNATRQWQAQIIKACPNCTAIFEKIITPSGFWIEIVQDHMVLEVNTQPVSEKEFKAMQDEIQKLVWDTAAQVGLTPQQRIGGGHIHLDIETHFGNDPRLFRNFVVLLFNNPELFMGGLSKDFRNAPPFAFLGQAAIDEFKALIADFDSRLNPDIETLKNEIVEIYKKFPHPFYADDQRFRAKNQALAFGLDGTLELRGLKPQASARHFSTTLEFLNKIISHLKAQGDLIAVQIPDYSKQFSHSTRIEIDTFETRISGQRILQKTYALAEWVDFDPARLDSLLTAPLLDQHQGQLLQLRVPYCRTQFTRSAVLF